MHFARIAYASDAPGSAAGARLYFDGRYTPLLSGWYSRSDNGYGNNRQLDREAMLKFVRLQTYATRTWASVPGQVYPDRRIGFAFNVSASSVDGATAAERAANLKSFADGFARAIKLGYSDTSNPQDVCEGAYVNCLPAASVATNGYWNLWNSWT